MKYLALIYGNESIWGFVSQEEFRAFVGRVDAFNRELSQSGELVMVDGVDPSTSVRHHDGVPVVSDGPYLEAKEHVGSMFIVDVEDHERALEIARTYPGIALGGGLELLPLAHHAVEA